MGRRPGIRHDVAPSPTRRFPKPEDLFGAALGIASPWEVTAVEFNKESSRLDITLDFQRGALFPCPICGTQSPVHNTTEKVRRHLNFFQYEAYLHARVPRVRCPNSDCGVKLVQVPMGSLRIMLYPSF